MSNNTHSLIDDIYMTLMAGDAPLLVGPSGCGKTHIGEQIAAKMGLPFSFISRADSDYQLKGFPDANRNTHKTEFRKMYENGGLFMFEEIDSSDPSALLSINPALSNGVLDAPDGMIKRHLDFYFMAAANTWGNGATLDYVGRNALDGATLDRFAMFAMDYDEELERKIVHDKYNGKQDGWVATVQQARAAESELELRHIISMRASLQGAALLTQGMDIETVFKARVLRGLNDSNALALTYKINENGNRVETLKDFEEKSSTLNLDTLSKSLEYSAKSFGVADILNDINNRLDVRIPEDIKTIKSEIETLETKFKTKDKNHGLEMIKEKEKDRTKKDTEIREQIANNASELKVLSYQFNEWTNSPLKNTVRSILGMKNKILDLHEPE